MSQQKQVLHVYMHRTCFGLFNQLAEKQEFMSEHSSMIETSGSHFTYMLLKPDPSMFMICTS